MADIGSLIAGSGGIRVPAFDSSALGQIMPSYWEGLNQAYQQSNRNAFQNGLPSDPQQLISTLARVQGTAAAPQIMQYYKMLFGQQADQAVNGASPTFSPPPLPSPNGQSGFSGPVSAGSPVPSSPRVMGDAEGVASGLYDAAATPGARPPMQPDAMRAITPNQRVAQGFPSPGALVAPQDVDPTLGGLVPQGRTPEQQIGLLSKAISSGMLEEGQSKLFQSKIDAIHKAIEQYRGGNVKNSELAQDQKVARDPAVQDYNANKTLFEQDAKDFQKEYMAAQSLGKQAIPAIEKAQLMKSLTLQPGFYSGPLHEGVQTFNQFRSIFGSNPSSALPQEAFNKVANDMLTEQVKSMGQSGVGRVLQSEVNIMKQAIASLGITPQSNRALAEMIMRTSQKAKDISDIVNTMPRTPGRMTQGLDQAVTTYLNQHPTFTQQEKENPSLLGAPDAPPAALKWNPQQIRAWASRAGLKPGDAVRVNGQIAQVP